MTLPASLLIVDDDHMLCESLADILQAMGYEVDIALSCEQALEQALAKEFNLALIDIRLPNGDGLELLHRLKQMQPGLAGVMITGYGSMETVIEAMRRGAFEYVLKPLKMGEVLPVIREALKRQQEAMAEQQRLQQEIEAKEFYRSLSIRDELSGLYNYRYFREFLLQELRRSQRYSHPLSLLMVDIDNFKSYNDTYGHPAGDEALKSIARAMQNEVRGADFVARYGGEEFVIVLPETGKLQAAAVAQRLCTKIAEMPLPSGERLTVSIGVASYPEDALGNKELISRADKALYQAKQGGRNQVRVWEQ